MSEKEYKKKARNCFLQNTILINQNEQFKVRIEQLETQEKILLDRILTLQKTCGSLTDKVEKLKCCGNCKHYNYCPMQTNKECQSSNNTLKYKWEFADDVSRAG